jgi:hypothetical protein
MERFADDFMFQLADQEVNALVSQNVIPSRSLPFSGRTQSAPTRPPIISHFLKGVAALIPDIFSSRFFTKPRMPRPHLRPPLAAKA